MEQGLWIEQWALAVLSPSYMPDYLGEVLVPGTGFKNGRTPSRMRCQWEGPMISRTIKKVETSRCFSHRPVGNIRVSKRLGIFPRGSTVEAVMEIGEVAAES